jgi:hypothetical protein
MQGFGGNLKVRGLSEDMGIDGRIMLKWIIKRNRDVNWIHLAWDRETVMNLLVLKNSSFLTS